MKELIKQYLDRGISRRKLITGLTSVGMSTVAAKAMAQNLAPAAGGRRPRPSRRRERARCTAPAARCSWRSSRPRASSTSSSIPSTGDSPIFDALVDEPTIQLIKGVQEGAVVAMADGYARASGKPGVVDRRQYRPAERDDPDGQQLQGSDPDRGRGRLGRP